MSCHVRRRMPPRSAPACDAPHGRGRSPWTLRVALPDPPGRAPRAALRKRIFRGVSRCRAMTRRRFCYSLWTEPAFSHCGPKISRPALAPCSHVAAGAETHTVNPLRGITQSRHKPPAQHKIARASAGRPARPFALPHLIPIAPPRCSRYQLAEMLAVPVSINRAKVGIVYCGGPSSALRGPGAGRSGPHPSIKIQTGSCPKPPSLPRCRVPRAACTGPRMP